LKLLSREKAAEYLGVLPETLASWACTKRYNLPFIKIGRLVKYRLEDLDNFIKQRTVSFENASNLNHKKLKENALQKKSVRDEYDNLREEFKALEASMIKFKSKMEKLK
jgi:excisionase family DNA binding protein